MHGTVNRLIPGAANLSLVHVSGAALPQAVLAMVGSELSAIRPTAQAYGGAAAGTSRC